MSKEPLRGARLRMGSRVHLYVIIFILAVSMASPSFATIVLTNPDINYPTQKWEVTVTFSGTDAEGLINTMPLMWGTPTAIDYCTWTTTTPQVNGEFIWFLPDNWAAADNFGELTITRTDLDGNDTLISGAAAVIGFTWE